MLNIDLNTVNEQDLARIPGIDKNAAHQIISFRQRSGSFKSMDDVKKVPGLPQGVVDVLQRVGAKVGKQPAA